ncbi:MAG: DUF3558 family protein [Candidatus Nanopelagicales bacterium]|jgi:hypothetical protein|nr:DUF3558 family protein [Candidatus Nanopelagicales bacterium]MCU0299102.1 DUF3558 family protein [Candidatus Nanopelagicales bacterium]
MMLRFAQTLTVVTVLLLAGCGGSSDEPPATPSAAASEAAPSPVAADDACGLLSAEEINQVLGTTFTEGEQTTDDARQIVTCTYTMTDSSSGVELPVGIVVVAVSQIDGQESYDTNVELAPAYFGNDPETTEVAGADEAYIVINEETQSPVVGALVGERFLQVQVGVEGATAEQAQELAALAVSRAG